MIDPVARRQSVVFVRVAAAASVFLLLAAAASGPAFAKKKGKGKGKGGHAAAAASGSGKRVAIMGSDAKPSEDGPVRSQLTKVLKKQKMKLAPKPKGTAPSDDQGWMALARTLKVDGFVIPAFEESGGKRSVEIVVRTASDGTVVATETFTAKGAPKKLAAAVGKGFWKQLGTSLQQVSAPAAGQEGTGMPARDLSRDAEPGSEPSKTATETEKAPSEPTEKPASTATETPPAGEKSAVAADATKPKDDEADEGAGTSAAPVRQAAPPKREDTERGGASGPKLPALSVRIAGRFVSRSFAYTANPTLPTSTTTSPTIGGAASWFPITYVGLEVSGEFASWLKFVSRYPTITSDVAGGLVLRLPLSFGELSVHGGGFRHMLAIQDDGTGTRTEQLLPDLVYVGIRAGGGLTLHITDAFTAALEGSYRLIMNMNGGAYAITNGQYYFPNAVPGPGLDVALTLSYRITRSIEVLAGFDMRRYVLSTRGSSSTRINASYLTDQSMAGWIGVGGVFGGH